MTVALRDVRWAAGGRSIVDGVTLDVPGGATLGLLGPNGSGKSSLLRLIAGLRKPAGGTVMLDGVPIARLRRAEAARRMAFVAQDSTTEVAVTLGEVVRLGRTPHRGAFGAWTERDQQAVATALACTGLAGREHQPWHTLSGGERQRTQIARALAQSPQLLLLDEPTNHLDIRHQLDILALVRGLGITSIVALHDLNLAATFCTRVAVLSRGRLVGAGPPEDILTPALIHDVFGVRADIQPRAGGDAMHIRLRR